jgi:microcin C transport system substrate-binding protein
MSRPERSRDRIVGPDPALKVMLFYKPSLERRHCRQRVRSTRPNTRTGFWNGFRRRHRVWPESLSPGNEQREFWGSKAADITGSRNVIGIKNPAIDKLIDRVIFAKDRDDLIAATRALDRVLLWNHYVVPQWNYPKVRTARWDRFGRPAELPKYGLSGFPTIWWYEADKAARLGKRS